MASQDKIVEMIFAVKVIYPYYAKETDVATLVRTWGVMVKDIPDDVFEAAFYQALRVCKMPPTPADILEQVKSMERSMEPSGEELWDVFVRALEETMRLSHRFGFTYVDHTGLSQGEQARRAFDRLWDRMPDQIKRYCATKGEMLRIAREVRDEGTKYEKARFLKTLPVVEKRMEYGVLALGSGIGNMDLLEG